MAQESMSMDRAGAAIIMLIVLWQQPASAAARPTCQPQARPTAYVLSFPESGLDDPRAYNAYQTRFFRDAARNTVQVYLKEGEGRVVNLWADAANESVGFSVRDSAGKTARLGWASDTACVASSGSERSIEYQLVSPEPEIRIGHFVLGSMRVERDFQYAGYHLEPFGNRYQQPELLTLIANIGRLAAPEQTRHLAALNATGLNELRRRLNPAISLRTKGARRIARIEQPSFDGRTRLVLELAVPAGGAELRVDAHGLRVRAYGRRPIIMTVRITTNAAALTPLTRTDIFNKAFLAFSDSVRNGAENTPPARRLERQIRGVELLSSQEKLMAGLPNFATYFGRDMLVTALLMQPIWSSGMNEHVIASALRKLSPLGEVSHEEALGGQAMREHAQQYSMLVARSIVARADRANAQALGLQDSALTVLQHLAQVRENYAMVDDEFQLPVVAGRYLSDASVTNARKRAFLNEPGKVGEPTPRLDLLMRNLMLVADLTSAYARDPNALNLVSFPQRADGSYQSASWRDSNAGYGGGRFAMDVNTIWVPHALESIQTILRALPALGITTDDLERALPALRGSVLGTYGRDATSLQHTIDVWRGAGKHFIVRLSPADANARIARKLAWLPAGESAYWANVLRQTSMPEGGVEFRAVSLDAQGRPIGIANTDVATRWFLDDITGAVWADPARADIVLRELAITTLPYPRGLFVEQMGPLVANDAFATPEIWEAFRRDEYHSPRVVWGREVNLLLLGLMRQIGSAYDSAGQLRDPRLRPYVTALDKSLHQTLTAIEQSGLEHNELWSYRIEGGRLLPVRWGSSSDVQLWNLTNLAVQFLLAGTPSIH